LHPVKGHAAFSEELKRKVCTLEFVGDFETTASVNDFSVLMICFDFKKIELN